MRLGYADYLVRRNTPRAVSQGIALAPGSAGHQARLAALDPRARTEALHKAVSENPYYSAGWMELGLEAEMDKDYRDAERFLLDAARVDKTYLPRWTLANYYFRRQDRENFWNWAARSAEMAYDDQSGLFQLCWRMSQDPEEILTRAIPARPRILAQYLNFLLRTERLEAAGGTARRLVGTGELAYREPLLAYCGRLAAARRVDAAVDAWNRLSRHGWIPYPPLDPAHGRSLTNGGLAGDFLSQGFDWRLLSVPGISAARAGQGGLRISFSGNQPERCRVLEQFLPLAASRNYRLRFRYRTARVQPGAGLRWRVFDAFSGADLSTDAAELSSDDWTEGEMSFRAPPAPALARLSLRYERATGTTRMEGSVFVGRVTLGFGE